MDSFDDHRSRINKQSSVLTTEFSQIIEMKSSSKQKERLSSLSRQAGSLRNRLDFDFRRFRRDVYRPLLGNPAPIKLSDTLCAFRDSLADRFDSVITSDVQGTLEILDKLVRNCKKNQNQHKEFFNIEVF